jgi:hypothetical protein
MCHIVRVLFLVQSTCWTGIVLPGEGRRNCDTTSLYIFRKARPIMSDDGFDFVLFLLLCPISKEPCISIVIHIL